MILPFLSRVNSIYFMKADEDDHPSGPISSSLGSPDNSTSLQSSLNPDVRQER